MLANRSAPYRRVDQPSKGHGSNDGDDQVGYLCVGSRRARQLTDMKALKLVLVVVGIIFVALVYPMVIFIREEPALSMMLSLYVTLGIFLLIAARNPSAH